MPLVRPERRERQDSGETIKRQKPGNRAHKNKQAGATITGGSGLTDVYGLNVISAS